jgi:hypothetical protein
VTHLPTRPSPFPSGGGPRGGAWAMRRPERSARLRAPRRRTSRFYTTIGRGAAPVWCHPRRREEAERNPRASSEAGTRRTHVRWEPTHGYQQDHPSSLTGSVSSDAPMNREQDHEIKFFRPTLDSGSHINAQGSAAGAKPPPSYDWDTTLQTAAVPPVRLQPVVRRRYPR